MAGIATALLLGLAMLGAPSASGSETLEEPDQTLRVMTFNIWVGGEQVDFDQVVTAIETADADVVGIQEASGNLGRLADQLGWHHLPETGRHQQVISRYPLVRGSDDLTYVLVDPAHAVAVADVHLRAFPYGPYDLRDGATVEEVLANEGHHLNELADHFEVLPELAADDVPVFLVGDFNVPSHLDWTQAAADASDEPFRIELEWPVSARLDDLGFRDSFREVHPDEVATPAYTWTPGYPPPVVTDDEVHDRIDFVYTSGPTTTLDSAVVGEPHPISDIVVDPWPSDHRAVVSEFAVDPKPTTELDPSLLTDAAAYDSGEQIVADFVGARPGARITVTRTGQRDPACQAPTSDDRSSWPAAGQVAITGAEAGCRWPLAPGEYVLGLRSGGSEVASTHILVRDPAAQATLELDRHAYVSGDPIIATWTNAPGNATDWVGIYAVGEQPGQDPSRFWQYVGGGQTASDPVIDGSLTFSTEAPWEGAATWPPEPGDYVAYLFAEDGYEILAQVEFSVTSSGSGG